MKIPLLVKTVLKPRKVNSFNNVHKHTTLNT
jgi:hypothetical protein